MANFIKWMKKDAKLSNFQMLAIMTITYATGVAVMAFLILVAVNG